MRTIKNLKTITIILTLAYSNMASADMAELRDECAGHTNHYYFANHPEDEQTNSKSSQIGDPQSNMKERSASDSAEQTEYNEIVTK